MKMVLTVVGLLTLAQWVFVGLLYGFLFAQDKNSPETYHKLHSMPVIGGYFPNVRPPTEDEEKITAREQLAIDIQKARRDYELPPGWTSEQLEELIAEVQKQREQFVDSRRELETREREMSELMTDFDRREENIAQQQAQLDEAARNLGTQRDSLDAELQRFERQRNDSIDSNLIGIAKMVEGIKPQKAKELLVGEIEGLVDIDEREDRYQHAARLLGLLNPEASSAILGELEPVEYKRITDIMKQLPPRQR